jgi:glycosyltransferase involved in cell wall biosynthesis
MLSRAAALPGGCSGEPHDRRFPEFTVLEACRIIQHLDAWQAMYSVIVPIYRNAEFVPLLISEFGRIAARVAERFRMPMEVVFVVDGCPDNSYELLKEALPDAPFRSQLVLHTRNFGSFAAMRTGLRAAKGETFGIIAGDLQEPPELLIAFLENLVDDGCDIVIGVRESRDDPAASRFYANLFWWLYRRLIIKDIPEGGIDLFACNLAVRNELLRLDEAHSSLVGLLFWLGFRRREVSYSRRARAMGKSAWTFGKKVTYLLDSVFAFTDLPIRILTFLGAVGVSMAVGLGIMVTLLRLIGDIAIPGYAATVLVITFFGALNMLGIGLIGSYVWRTYENTKRRPLALVQRSESFDGGVAA